MKIPASLAATCCLVLLVGGGVSAAQNPGLGNNAPPGQGGNPGIGQGQKPQLPVKVLEFQTMTGVDGPFLGGANPIRDLSGGGLPWVLDAAKGELRDDGHLEVQVMGLVIPEDSAPTSCGGVACNPAPFFRAIVSCLTVDETGAVVTDKVITDNGAEVMIGDPKSGDAKIEATIDLPDPCVAPIVFVTNPTGAWFAATGVGAIPGL